ncbi:MAG: DNA alkylation repair protein [Porphyromonas sp.]|nr:DNA alkylation repair protein [Porphyromonas sp.]
MNKMNGENKDIKNRKGARSMKKIPSVILKKLNAGEIESVNLTESLAIDQRELLENFLLQSGRMDYLEPILKNVDDANKVSYNAMSEIIGEELLLQAGKHGDDQLFSLLRNHLSDMVRCWAAYFIGRDKTLSISELLEKIKPFAADSHFGVREIAWLSVRPRIAEELLPSIEILSSWTSSLDENVRRFSTESTRPQGVWCKHIPLLKESPELALPILEPLRSDGSKYVRESVGNWLNDASKSKPIFVQELCARWCTESDTKETRYIVKKALRTLSKKSNILG